MTIIIFSEEERLLMWGSFNLLQCASGAAPWWKDLALLKQWKKFRILGFKSRVTHLADCPIMQQTFAMLFEQQAATDTYVTPEKTHLKGIYSRETRVVGCSQCRRFR